MAFHCIARYEVK